MVGCSFTLVNYIWIYALNSYDIVSSLKRQFMNWTRIYDFTSSAGWHLSWITLLGKESGCSFGTISPFVWWEFLRNMLLWPAGELDWFVQCRTEIHDLIHWTTVTGVKIIIVVYCIGNRLYIHKTSRFLALREWKLQWSLQVFRDKSLSHSVWISQARSETSN